MLGPRIAALRRSSGMSQAVLANQLQVSPSAVGMYEQGRREPSAETLVAMARIFGVTTDYLLTGQPSDSRDSTALNQAVLHTLSEAEETLPKRRGQPFTREELAVLIAAMLMGS